MALPRLRAPVPVTLALSASNPPGMLRFFATCAAATHWPRFLKPLHAVAASSPGSALILPALTVWWLRTLPGEAGDRTVGDVAGPASWGLLMPAPPAAPCPA